MFYIYIYSPWIYFDCPFWESLVTYQYHGMGYRFTQMTGGVRSFLTFMPLVLLGGSLACSFLGHFSVQRSHYGSRYTEKNDMEWITLIHIHLTSKERSR